MLNTIEDLSGLKPAIGCYLASKFGGSKNIANNKIIETFVKRLVMLVDKVIYEYEMARVAILSEENQKLDKKSYLYFPSISNHIENCIVTLVIIFKLLDTMDQVFLKNALSQIELILSIKGSSKDKINEIKITFSKMEQFKKTMVKLNSEINKKNITKIRNSISHIDEEILKGTPGWIMPYLEQNRVSFQVLTYKLSFKDLSLVIKRLHTFICNIL